MRAAACAPWASSLGDLRSVCGRVLPSHEANAPPVSHAPMPCSCCDLQGSAHALWVSWTVAGCLGLALALMCSARLAWAAVAARKVGQCSVCTPFPCACFSGMLLQARRSAPHPSMPLSLT